MANISTLACPVCPHCGVENVSFVYVASADSYNGEPYLHLWKCGNCNKGLCTEGYTSIISGGNNIRDFTDVYPHHQEIVAPYGTPDTMASSYRTAIRCLRAGKDADYEAACVMARRCIELAVNDIGGEGHNLFQKINYLENKRLIPPAMRDWAQHLREIGNEGAHGQETTREDAQQAVYFAEMLFTYLYSLPAKMREYRQE